MVLLTLDFKAHYIWYESVNVSLYLMSTCDTFGVCGSPYSLCSLLGVVLSQNGKM
jgi:hypothetical protein